MAFPAYCLEENWSSSSCPNTRQFSSSQCVPGSFWAAASVWSSEGVNPSRSLCRPFKRNCLGLQEPPFHSWFLQPEFMGTSLPGTGREGSLGWDPGVGILAPKGRLQQPRYPSQFLSVIYGYEAQLVLSLHSSYKFWVGFFFISLVVGLQFS